MLDYLYLLTFFSWLPLAVLAIALRDDQRTARRLWWACGATLLVCGYELYLEFIWPRRVVAPIRVDLLFAIPAATITFITIGVWAWRKPGALAKAASILLLALSVPPLTVFSARMWGASRDAARLDGRPALIFEAQFRNPQTFQNFFGRIDSAGQPRAGHFTADRGNAPFTRAIVNDRGRLWLFTACGQNVECAMWQADVGAFRVPGALTTATEFGQRRDMFVSQWTADHFTIELSPANAATLVRSPVPYRESSPRPAAVIYHGAWSQTRVEQNYANFVQMWLWQSGDRWLAYYLRRIAQCGSTTDFVSASPYRGTTSADQIAFESADPSQRIESFRIAAPERDRDTLDGEILYAGRPLESLSLRRGASLRSPIYDSAPLADLDATADWLRTVSMGYMLTWTANCGTG